MEQKEMSLEKIVEHINKELSSGRTMKSIEMEDFGVSERTMVRMLERRNYIKKDKEFVPIEKKDTLLAQVVGSISNTKSSNTKLVIRDNLNILEDENFLKLAKKVEMMEIALTELMKRSNDSSSTNESTDFTVYSSDKKPVGKTVRLYPEIWEGLDKVKEIYNHLSSQTIVNSLLNEIINKYIR